MMGKNDYYDARSRWNPYLAEVDLGCLGYLFVIFLISDFLFIGGIVNRYFTLNPFNIKLQEYRRVI
jgi:hypothetical protein